ncbi:penicillin acylase family protein, partial [Paracidovorax cattleyae]|uniref:penicillin acylase family protein n=1 Tax=Paracidovorax cattleyae TaxID=80868 RepID=UPI001E4AF0E0
MRTTFRGGLRPLSLCFVASLAACGGGHGRGDLAPYSAEIRRTAMGVPHIKASTWGGAGFGYGYAQAQDNLCTLADAFVTYRGERSRYFGGSAQVIYNSTLGRPLNIDSDFFHRHVISADVVEKMMAAQPEKLRQMVEGFAAGYNRYLGDLQADSGAHAACRNEAWVQPVTVQDIWRRMFAATSRGGYSNFAAAIANATAPAAARSDTAAAAPQSKGWHDRRRGPRCLPAPEPRTCRSAARPASAATCTASAR